MKRIALVFLPVGGLIVGSFLLAFLQGQSIPTPELPLLFLGIGMLLVSIRVLLPWYSDRDEQRLARLESMNPEQRHAYFGRLFRKQLVVIVVALIIELLAAALFWSFVEWRGWIVAPIGTTLLFLILLVGLISNRKSSRQGAA